MRSYLPIALAVAVSASSFSEGVQAYDEVSSERLNIGVPSEGSKSAIVRMEDLWVHIEIRRDGLWISERERVEVCVHFENDDYDDWRGGYRLTDRLDSEDARRTHASMTVPGYNSVYRCETLNPQDTYTVVLRRNRD